MNKNIINRNSKGKRHGYQERYWGNGKLMYKCFYNNGDEIDYDEDYYTWSGGLEKRFYI